MSKGKIGLIAGNGAFPMIFAGRAREMGLSVVAAAHEGETTPALSDQVDEILWVRVGQIGKLISFFKKKGVDEAVMAGGIKKTRIFDFRPDLKAIAILSRIKEKKDDVLLRAFADALEKENIQIRESTFLLTPLLAHEGEWTRPLKKEEKSDVEWGWALAKKVGALDIGQCIVVRNGVILAVEAIEGTDAAIRRGGTLGKKNAVVIKICKPQQDLRFDLPTIGLQTLEVMEEVKASVLVVEAKKTIVLEKDQFIKEAAKAGIAVVGYTDHSEEKKQSMHRECEPEMKVTGKT